MPTPIDNQQVFLLGEVSVGKTTLIEAMFCSKHQRGQTSLKRTTMVPMKFHESAGLHSHHEGVAIARRNAELIKSSEAGIPLTIKDCIPLEFSGCMLHMGCPNKYSRTITDIPGLNDARTRNVYYKYMEKNFSSCNVVLFVIDITSGLNTSDEMDILNLITSNTLQAIAQGKDIQTIVIANKVDDMVLDDDGIPRPTDELAVMYEQISSTVTKKFAECGISDHLAGIIPLSANDAYIYRMIDLYASSFALSNMAKTRIGINEVGKKFTSVSKASQENTIHAIISDAANIKLMLQISGFTQFQETFNGLFATKGDKMVEQNILYKLNQYQSIPKMISSSKLSPIDISAHVEVYAAMRSVNPAMFEEHMTKLVAPCVAAIDSQIIKYSSPVELHSVQLSIPVGMVAGSSNAIRHAVSPWGARQQRICTID